MLRALALVMIAASAAHADCPKETIVVVDTKAHALVLCAEGRATATYAVALGSAGTGKTKEGDNKTPLGIYPLAAPKVSALFGQFLAIGFPTAEQRKQGLTGSDLGIHGPPRPEDKRARTGDWTRGCVAVGDDATIDKVAKWVRDHKVTRVDLR